MTDRGADAAAFERGSDAVPVVILVGEAGKDEKRIAQLVGQRAIIVLASTAEALRPLEMTIDSSWPRERATRIWWS